MADYIALDNEGTARRLVKKVFEQAELLEGFSRDVPATSRFARYGI